MSAPYDPTGVRPGPDMNPHHTDQKQTPCRRHLYETWAAIAPQHRHHAHWRIPTTQWEAMKRDPGLNADWLEHPGHSLNDGTARTLLGLPVQLVARGLDTASITVNVNCEPDRRR